MSFFFESATIVKDRVRMYNRFGEGSVHCYSGGVESVEFSKVTLISFSYIFESLRRVFEKW